MKTAKIRLEEEDTRRMDHAKKEIGWPISKTSGVVGESSGVECVEGWIKWI